MEPKILREKNYFFLFGSTPWGLDPQGPQKRHAHQLGPFTHKEKKWAVHRMIFTIEIILINALKYRNQFRRLK